MYYDVEQAIRKAAAGPSSEVIEAACALREICIDLKVRETSFDTRSRGMIAEIFRLQLDLRICLERYELALSVISRQARETELRERVADIATALTTFKMKAAPLGGGEARFSPPIRQQHADVGVLTVIPTELLAVRSALNIDVDAGYVNSSGTLYWFSERQLGKVPRRVSLALGCIGEAGNYDAAAATERMISTFKPSLMLLVGIAAGIRGKMKIGEVSLADRIVAYEFASAEPNSTSRARPEITKPSHRITQLMAAYEKAPGQQRATKMFRDVGWQFPARGDHDKTEWSENVARSVLIRNSTIVSGEKLLRDPEKLVSLREIHGKIEVGEMEGSGFSKCCDVGKVEWLVIRGISDFGDHLKDDQFHDFASRTAAVVAVDVVNHLVTMGLLDRRNFA